MLDNFRQKSNTIWLIFLDNPHGFYVANKVQMWSWGNHKVFQDASYMHPSWCQATDEGDMTKASNIKMENNR